MAPVAVTDGRIRVAGAVELAPKSTCWCLREVAAKRRVEVPMAGACRGRGDT